MNNIGTNHANTHYLLRFFDGTAKNGILYSIASKLRLPIMSI
jgi:hypothetical protein